MAPAMHEDRLPVQQLAILCMSLLRFLTLSSPLITCPPISNLSNVSNVSCCRFSVPICRYTPLLLLEKEKREAFLLIRVVSSHMPLCRTRCSDKCKPLSPGNDREFRRQARRGCEVGWAHQCDFFGGAMFDGYAVGARYVDPFTTIQCLPNVSMSP